jgi:voltage-gated potassium channel
MGMSADERLAFRSRWEAVTHIPLIAVGGIFLLAYSLYVLVPDPAPWLTGLLVGVLALVWVVFLADYLVRLIVSPRGTRAAFVRRNAIDLLSVLLPMFRAFRLVGLLRDIPYFRARSAQSIRLEVVAFATGYAVLFVYFLALATLDAERNAPGATITSFGDAVWWACVTLATVGYGDTYPITVTGRICAVVLMMGGIVIVGTTSALVISYLGERMRTLTHRGDRPES